MSIEAAIHRVWASDAVLCGYIPQARVFTGRMLGEFTLPYALVNREGASPEARTTDSEVWTQFVRVDVYVHHDELQQGRALLERLNQRLNRQTLPYFADDASLMVCQRTGGPEQVLTPDGVWELSMSYQATVNTTAGALG